MARGSQAGVGQLVILASPKGEFSLPTGTPCLLSPSLEGRCQDAELHTLWAAAETLPPPAAHPCLCTSPTGRWASYILLALDEGAWEAPEQPLPWEATPLVVR